MEKNDHRAERAYRTILYYQQLSNKDVLATSVQDLLTDLLHLSEQYSFSLPDLLEVATINYEAEK